MSDTSDAPTTSSPTPDQPGYDGDMSKKEYENQPESNVGATVERDVDEPNPKEMPEDEKQDEVEAAMQSTAEQVTAKQHQKLESNTKPGEDPPENDEDE